MILGEYIRMKYLEKNLTQIAYAEKCGLSEVTVRNIEKGKTKKISLSTYRALPKGLDMTLKELLENTGEISSINEISMTYDESEIFINEIAPILSKYNINLYNLTEEEKLKFSNDFVREVPKILDKSKGYY